MENYTGVRVIEVKQELIAQLYQAKYIPITFDQRYRFSQNEYVILKDQTVGPNKCESVITRCVGDRLIQIKERYQLKASNVEPRNKEQHIALDALLDDRIRVTVLTGRAGSGKTLLSLAAALQKVDDRIYDKIILTRPMSWVGKHGLGALPGDENDKFKPYLQNYMCNIEHLLSGQRHSIDWLISQYHMQFIPIQLIRGASWANSFILADECFPGKQLIQTDKGNHSLQALYNKYQNNKQLPRALSFNEETGFFEYRQINHVTFKGKKPLVKICIGSRKINCTADHLFLTQNGWKPAKNLSNQLIVSTQPVDNQRILKVLNEDQKQILIGSFLGDGCLQKIGKKKFRLSVIHGIKQSQYCEWKAEQFQTKTTYIEKNGFSQKPAVKFTTKAIALDVSDKFANNRKHIPQWIIDDLSPKSLAILLMDDGHINHQRNMTRIFTCGFDQESNERLALKLNTMGIKCSVQTHKKKYPYICVNVKGTTELIKLVGPYVHPSMIYKLQGAEITQENWGNNQYKSHGLLYVDKVEDLYEEKEVFDLEIDHTHNFIITNKTKQNTGIVVHNCQILDYHEMVTLGTRVGENSKIIILGDLAQRDEKIAREKTGIHKFINHQKAKDSSLVASVELIKCVRSDVSKLFAEVFER